MLRYEDLPEINSPRWLSLEKFEGEEWRDIEGAKGSYMVSNYGRIKALARERANNHSTMIWQEKIRRLGYNKKGYPIIHLSIYGVKTITKSVHVIVANAFIPNIEGKPQIDHINTLRTDNRVCNLRWVTAYENAHNKITEKRVLIARSKQIGVPFSVERKRKIGERAKHYKRHYGKDHHKSKQVIQMSLEGEYIREWDCARDASKIYGCHIIDCCKGHRNQCGGYRWKYKIEEECI